MYKVSVFALKLFNGLRSVEQHGSAVITVCCTVEMLHARNCRDGVTELQEMMDKLVSERRDLIQERDMKLKQVTHLSEMVADLQLQLESVFEQDQYKTQLYGDTVLWYIGWHKKS